MTVAPLRKVGVALLAIALAQIALAAGEPPDQTYTYVGGNRPFRGAQAYFHQASGLMIYVETDGRHIVAIDPKGKIRWIKDPVIDAHLEPYRTDTPQIVYVGLPAPRPGPDPDSSVYIGITYNNTQFGLIDIRTGEFKFEGQD